MKKININLEEKKEIVRKRLLLAAASAKRKILNEYNASYDGFDEEEVVMMRDEYGENEITHNVEHTLLKLIIEAFINPFTIILLVLAIISFFTNDIPAALIVLTMVIISGVLRFIQEGKSEVAAQKLTELVETTITVQRKILDNETGKIKSKKMEIPLDELVVGDILYLSAGDMIPADVRILKAKDLFIRQSSLTGESEPVEKFESQINDEKDTTLLDQTNLAFMGSNVISGSALAIPVAVGDDTLFGAIANQLESKKTVTSFEKGINSVSFLLIRFMLIMVPIVLFLNGFTKGDWMQAFLFALSVAVGLTPEMLPMIVSANLAKGAVSMSKKEVIVKNLNSIQNFGAMDILCTDKTGTITQDKVILEYHLDIEGNEDDRVLRHAFLNSYFQTGLKNLMDIAIIEYATEIGVNDLIENYKKIDEIPFDFNRRRMSVVVEDKKGKTQLITKGAIEEMLSVSSYVEYKGEITKITDDIKKEILKTCYDYNEDGMRVLGISQKTNTPKISQFSADDEKDMVLIGYLAFLDPPKDSAEEAILALKEYGVEVKVLTGDNDAVTKCVCKQVGLSVNNILLGCDIEDMSDKKLKKEIEKTNVFAKLSPSQKARIVNLLRDNGHTVGFMGDGINDAAAMKASDIGISVDTAVDIAKESANIILMEKDLMVLEEGVLEGRKTYANIIKYIKMTASSNFGNMLSVLVASAFLPFLPMLPIQILALNLIYDISCTAMPWDNVDIDYLKKPRKWDASSISKFMFFIGPTSSVFDIATYILMFFFICPLIFGGSYNSISPEMRVGFMALFHTGWFVESLWSQTLVIHMLRTKKTPFIKSRASFQVIIFTSLGVLFGTILPFTKIGTILDMTHLPLIYFPCLFLIIICYMMLVTFVKNLFVKKYGELL